MDVSTEKERVSLPLDLVNELLALCKPEDHELRDRVKQAARRAPVVPAGWKLVPVEPTPEMIREGHKFFPMDAPTQDLYVRMLAAAPQPPEIQPKSCIPEIQTIGCKQAAPVELPEPNSYIFQNEETGLTTFVDAQQVEWGFEKNNPRWKRVGEAYSEQQVRALLASRQVSTQESAAHG